MDETTQLVLFLSSYPVVIIGIKIATLLYPKILVKSNSEDSPVSILIFLTLIAPVTLVCGVAFGFLYLIYHILEFFYEYNPKNPFRKRRSLD